MNFEKLTQKRVDGLKPQVIPYTLWDTKRVGLGVQVNETSLFYVIRAEKGVKRIAPVESLLLRQAREKVKRDIEKTANRSITGSVRFDVFVQEEWSSNVCSMWKPSSQRIARSALRCHLVPEFGRYPLHRIDSRHVQRWFDELSRTFTGAANRNIDVLRSIFSAAVKYGYCGSNPCDGIKQNRKRTLNRFLSKDELVQLDNALNTVSQNGEMEMCCCLVLRLILLTGCRISEITGLQWSYVKGDEWHLPDSKTGAKVVYVGKEAQALLRQIRKRYPTPINNVQDEVFSPLSRYVCRKMKVSVVWQRVRKLANIEDVRIHDLRHTFASYAVMEGYPLPMVAKLLGHQRISSTLRYTHVSDTQVLDSVQNIGNVLSDIVSGKPEKPPHKTPLKKRINKTKIVKNRNKGSSHSTLTDEEVRHIRDELDFANW
ncbi:tyrosine-type recombinase/integrase [Vibrio mediterranei]|jgi:integrase|uniref:tyrosine-type recombinase/integrase n=1 Tax=Vibrio mediterranei TaxID=689 RepID=UPI00148BE222|nr:site-specific integrase [Vibrio mediterranei]NOH31499.1 site-specific integrase [Vibrio mediterranei]